MQNNNEFLGDNTFVIESDIKDVQYQEIDTSAMESKKKETPKELVGAESFDIAPDNGNLLIIPFATNPFNQMVINDKGYIENISDVPKVKNPDSGEIEDSEEGVSVARIVGLPKGNTKYKIGDLVYFISASKIPVPFMHTGVYCIHEQRVLAVVAPDISKRWNTVNKKKNKK